MQQRNATGIVLNRLNFREHDRIITVLSLEQGKLHLIAKGVRTMKSKLSGGIELFAISELSYIKGKGELGTLTGSRLKFHFPAITKHLERVQTGYSWLKLIDKTTEDEVEAEYFHLLSQAIAGLGDENLPLNIVRLWFAARLIGLAGHLPNLNQDSEGRPLDIEGRYFFSADKMSFEKSDSGRYDARHIKFIRLLFNTSSPQVINRVQGVGELPEEVRPLLLQLLSFHFGELIDSNTL